ncbi:MAG: N-acetyl sugar amidotransferase [Bacteroidetes bacterium]|nr:N-acetyl sugar amidotransferase [Bacteroidota bacterium]
MELKEFKYTGSKLCSRCIMDDTVQGIEFDEKGECTFCKIHDELEAKYPLGESSTNELAKIAKLVKEKGRNKKYDCIVGVSGGRDSSYTLYNAVRLGLRPLAVHFDNGWNSENAVSNIENICKKLNVDLYTHVANWEEFKDLQKSFLYASVPDAEVPTDWVIFSVLFEQARKHGVKYIIHGHSFRTEGTTPLTWTYMDGKYVNGIHQRFGKVKLKSFPVMTLWNYLYYTFFVGIKQVRVLYYIPYDEKLILKMLTDELGWRDYGGKHHESMYTGFFQSYILIRKFGIDKRKLHYSALLRSGQITRDEALQKVKSDPYSGGYETLDYCLKKLELTHDEFERIMNLPKKSFLDYPSYYKLVLRWEKLIRWGVRIGVVPDTVYRKFFRFKINR